MIESYPVSGQHMVLKLFKENPKIEGLKFLFLTLVFFWGFFVIINLFVEDSALKTVLLLLALVVSYLAVFALNYSMFQYFLKKTEKMFPEKILFKEELFLKPFFKSKHFFLPGKIFVSKNYVVLIFPPFFPMQQKGQGTVYPENLPPQKNVEWHKPIVLRKPVTRFDFIQKKEFREKNMVEAIITTKEGIITFYTRRPKQLKNCLNT